MLSIDMLSRAGFDWLFALINYGQRWRQHRRAVHSVMTPDVMQQFQPILLRVARSFLRDVLHSPQDLELHIRL